MHLYIQTILARRRRRRHKRHTVFMEILCAGLIAVICGIVWFFQVIRPALVDYAEDHVQYMVKKYMEDSVSSCTERMGNVGMIQTDAAGSVQCVSANTRTVNRLRAAVLQKVYEDSNDMQITHSAVSIGTLIDPQYLAGIGPKLPFSVTAMGNVDVHVKSSLCEAGINQTLYTITMYVTAEFFIQTLGSPKKVTVSGEYPLEEMVIVGEVPFTAVNS